MSAQAKSSKYPRQKPRYAARLKVEVMTKGLEHHRIEKTANISTTGLFICTDMHADLEDKMHLRIIFEDRDAYFDVKARIVWTCDNAGSHPQGWGLEFVELNQAQKDVIEKFLSEYVNIADS